MGEATTCDDEPSEEVEHGSFPSTKAVSGVETIKPILLARWMLVPGDEPGLLPGVEVPGTSMPASGSRGPRVLCLGCRCRVRRDAVGQMGGPCSAPTPELYSEAM